MQGKRSIIVSNRMPVTFRSQEGRAGVEMVKSSGGLVTALAPVHSHSDSLWVGYLGQQTGIDSEVAQSLHENRFVAVDVPEELYSKYYNGLANGAIWPLFHYFPSFAEFSREAWAAYRKVNQLFCDKVCEIVEEGDVVWVQDYQLMLLPQMLRERQPNLRVGYFHHIPFPASEVLRILPWCSEVLSGLLGADLVGFHTLEYARHFVSSVSRLLGLDSRGEDVMCSDRVVKVGAFPLGVDTGAIRAAESDPQHVSKLKELKESFKDKKLILGVDRLDYTKGIKERLVAFQHFLAKHPEFCQNTVFIQLCVPSRVDVLPYGDLRDEVEWLVGRINGEYGSPTHTPVQYLFQSISFPELTALYRHADVCLVTPLRDGLNLVCKEYVASKRDSDGVLVLSEFAGAAEEMGEALVVNPFNVNSVVSALERSLRMTSFEKSDRMHGLKRRVEEFNNQQWVESFFEMMDEAHDKNAQSNARELKSFELEKVKQRLQQADRVLVCYDYDTSVMGRREGKWSYLSPGEHTLPMLTQIASLPQVEVALVSRLSRARLDPQFPEPGFTLLAENGALFRRANSQEWESGLRDVDLTMVQAEVDRILQRCVRRVPRSTLDVQETSMIWEFERANSVFAHNLALQTSSALNEMLSNTSFQCVMGRHHLEVRPVQATKLRGVMEFCRMQEFGPHDVLMTIADGKREDDLFRAFPEQNIPINLGSLRSDSQLMVRGNMHLHNILKELFALEKQEAQGL